jgi:hypothetical protein
MVMKKDNPREIMDPVMLNTEYEVDDENEDENEKLIKSKNKSNRDKFKVTEERKTSKRSTRLASRLTKPGSPTGTGCSRPTLRERTTR